MASIACVPPDRVREVWPSVCPHVRLACERGGSPDQFGDIAHDVLNGIALLWFAWGKDLEAVAVTRIEAHGSNRICMILACAGLAPSGRWLHTLERIERYARDEGCAAIRLRGRKGWKRVLTGYAEPYVVLQKDL